MNAPQPASGRWSRPGGRDHRRAAVIAVPFLAVAIALAASAASAQEVTYGTGDWSPDSLGNHRAVVRVAAAAEAVRVHIPWRRRDRSPEEKNIIVVDGATGRRIANIARIEISRESGDLAFQPLSGPGDYYIYYLPHKSTGGNYPKVTYPKPERTADDGWLKRHGLGPDDLSSGAWRELPEARTVQLQAIDKFNSFWPMEVIATRTEMNELRAAHPDAAYLLFPEDRSRPIRMRYDLPYRWIESGPQEIFSGSARRGEFYAFQVGVYAMRGPIDDLGAAFSGLTPGDGGDPIPPSAFRCINLGGIDSHGVAFDRTQPVDSGAVQPLWCGVQIPKSAAPGSYEGSLTITPRGLAPTTVRLAIDVSPDTIAAAGDDEPWRHSRLRWLDSPIALNDSVVAPYLPVVLDGNAISILGRKVTIGDLGFPTRIASYFAPEMTHLAHAGTEMLAAPVALAVQDTAGRPLTWRSAGLRFTRRAPGVVSWEARSTAGALTLEVTGTMEFDGAIELSSVIGATRATDLGDIELVIPMRRDVARYMTGMGFSGGARPREFDWTWDVKRNQDGAWIGDVNAGLQFSMRDENYSRPLNTNFYHSKPLVMPSSWDNGGRGGCRMRELADAFRVTCYSGRRTVRPGDRLHYNFRLLVTPFRPIDPAAHFARRYFHRFAPVAEIKARGANVINVHHATEINPYINYPFLRAAEMKAYVDEAHASGMKVKIYYTVRELSNHAPEIFALRSLGCEIFSPGPGGGFAWLQEHLGDDYIPGWFVPPLKDAAVINSGVSRWHNYYLEGLNWLVRNVGIDGLYIDDVAFDRVTMKRVRKILDSGGPGKLIDLHSANQFNPRDGYASSANLYMEHFPYIDRLWFGEYFDYDKPPDYWLIEISGIPFGLMGEMLQDGGNPWRGMLYGMTSRMPWSGDPSPLWRLWDEFGIEQSRMIGYWVPGAPVRTDDDRVLATTYAGDAKALVSIASWAPDSTTVNLEIDWAALGIDAASASIAAPAIEGFQEARVFRPGDGLPVAPGRGWLLVITGP